MAFTKRREAIDQQKRLLLMFMFLKTQEPRKYHLDVLYESYIEYVRKYASMKFLFSKHMFGTLLRDFGVRREKYQTYNAWHVPDVFYPDDLIRMIKYYNREISDR